MEFETSDASDKEILPEDSCMESKPSGEEAELFVEGNAGESSSAEEQQERKEKAKSKSSNAGRQVSNGDSQKSLPGSSSGGNISTKTAVVSEAVTMSGFFRGPDSEDANAAERIQSSTYSRQRKQVDPTRKPRKGTSGKVDKIDGSESEQGEGEKVSNPRFELEEKESFDEEPEVKPKNSKRKKVDVDETSDEEYQTKAKNSNRKKPEPDERPKPKKPRAKPAKVAPALSETDSSAEAGEPDKRPKPKPKKPRAKSTKAVAPKVSAIVASKAKQPARRVPTFNVTKMADPKTSQKKKVDSKSSPKKNDKDEINSIDKYGEVPPTENTLVLHHIFELCSVEDLKSCRLVSRLWRDASGTAWRSSAVATINSNKAERKLSDFQLFSKDYNRDQEQIQETPFLNFRLLRTYDPGWFYNYWGSSVKFLKLECLTFESGKVFLNAIFNCCQNLEKLILVGVTVIKTEADKVGKRVDWDTVQENKKMKSLTILNGFHWKSVVWMEILIRCPSLQAFTLTGSVSNCDDLFESLRAIREQNPHNLNLKLIDIQRIKDMSHRKALLPVLLDQRFQLKSLKLKNVVLPDWCTSLSKILENNATSLKKLVFENIWDNLWNSWWRNNDHDPIRLPSQKLLDHLQELNINYPHRIGPLANFLKLMPNLRKLIFFGPLAKELGVNVSGAQDIKLNYCSELKLFVVGLTTQQLKHVINWMPNLKKLKINGLNNQKFSTVCEGWPNLVSLDARFCEMDDSGITGLDREDVMQINYHEGWVRRWGMGNHPIAIQSRVRPITAPRANITNLKALQRLNLSAARSCSETVYQNFGYCAVACGLELLPNLKYLKLENFRLTSPVESFLRNVRARSPWLKDEDEDYFF